MLDVLTYICCFPKIYILQRQHIDIVWNIKVYISAFKTSMLSHRNYAVYDPKLPYF